MQLKKMPSHNLTLILDAYNVIHAVPELERTLTGKLEDARMALIRYSQQYQEAQCNIAKVILVFDGRKMQDFFWDQTPSRYGSIEIVFSDAGQTADDKIIEILEKVKDPGNFAVISNDNYVGNNARAYGVRVLSVQKFDDAVKKKQTGTVASGIVQNQTARRITEEYKQYLGIKD